MMYWYAFYMDCFKTDIERILKFNWFFQASSSGSISIVHVLADRVAQSLLFRSPVFRPQVNVKVSIQDNILRLILLLHQFIFFLKYIIFSCKWIMAQALFYQFMLGEKTKTSKYTLLFSYVLLVIKNSSNMSWI